MLIDGQKVNIPFKRTIKFPRVEGDIIFTAVAVPCSDEFDGFCPSPEPPSIKDVKGNLVRIDFDDATYKKQVRAWHISRFDHQVIKSLENVQWETVDLKDPKTWGNWRKECVELGLSDTEVISLLNQVIETHQPSNELIEQMRSDFLATQALKTQGQDVLSQDTEPSST